MGSNISEDVSVKCKIGGRERRTYMEVWDIQRERVIIGKSGRASIRRWHLGRVGKVTQREVPS